MISVSGNKWSERKLNNRIIEKISVDNIHKVKFYPGVKSTLKYLIKKNYKKHPQAEL